MANFADPSVGAVSGELILESNPENTGAEGVGIYWKLEKWIRRKKSEHGAVVGVLVKPPSELRGCSVRSWNTAPLAITMINYYEKRGAAAIILYYQSIRVNRLGP